MATLLGLVWWQAASAQEVQVMILGTYHLANPNKDLHNVEVDDVTTPERQRQLEAVADALERFRPTRIAVEAVSTRSDLSLPAFESFGPETLREKASETVQIGFRLADRLGHAAVYGIDERSDEVDYFPYGEVQSFAEATGREAALDEMNHEVAAFVDSTAHLHSEGTVAEALAWMNEPGRIERAHQRWYYGLLEFADAERQPGALLNARYYLRNARIFAKLATVAEPGDRVLVVFGSGHSYWFRHLVRETPGFELVEAAPFLADGAAF